MFQVSSYAFDISEQSVLIVEKANWPRGRGAKPWVSSGDRQAAEQHEALRNIFKGAIRCAACLLIPLGVQLLQLAWATSVAVEPFLS
jgi:hypothetical protein